MAVFHSLLFLETTVGQGRGREAEACDDVSVPGAAFTISHPDHRACGRPGSQTLLRTGLILVAVCDPASAVGAARDPQIAQCVSWGLAPGPP